MVCSLCFFSLARKKKPEIARLWNLGRIVFSSNLEGGGSVFVPLKIYLPNYVPLSPFTANVICQAVACNEGHLFCRSCLQEWITAHGHRNYPVRRQPLQASDVRGIITFDKVVDFLEVYCLRRMEGCSWTGTLETISGHQQQRLHEPV